MNRLPVVPLQRGTGRKDEFRGYLKIITWLGIVPLPLILLALLLSTLAGLLRNEGSFEGDLPLPLKWLSIAAILSPFPLALAYLHLLARALFSATLPLRQFAWLMAGAAAFLAVLLAIVGKPLLQVM